MKKFLKLLYTTLASLLIFGTFTACSKEANNSSMKIDTSEIMDGMHTLYAGNTHGYSFGFDTKPSYTVDEDGIFELYSSTDTMYFSVESAGDDNRQLAVQFFIDYVQAPIIIDGVTYDTFFIDANEKFSQEYAFQFANKIDTSKNHKILGILTAYSNVLIATQDVVASGNDSICIDGILSFAKNNSLVEPQYNISEPLELYEDMFSGVLLNTEKKNIRKIPQKLVSAIPEETIHLKYHIGDDGGKESFVLLINIANRQAKINGQYYYYCSTSSNKIAYGDITIQAPKEPGMYEITAWSIPEPFSANISNTNTIVPMAMRFTLQVEE